MGCFIERLAKIDAKYRPIINKFPFPINSFFYSNARKIFVNLFSNAKINPIVIPDDFKIKLWDLDFNCGIFNAAGMFKRGEGYNVCAKMGAGGYIAGTTTFAKRIGNKKNGITHPFLPYSNSKSSSNWMGLPNPGHHFVANEISKIEKIKNCPIGISLSESPDIADGVRKIKEVVEGIKLYEKAGVDFIELNFSCPNVDNNQHNACVLDVETAEKLNYLSENFLKKRNRNLPVIAKYSNDITAKELFATIDVLVDLEFDGINIGNTSTKYDHYRSAIHSKDLHNYDKFTQTFGGGLSGEILKENSLHLCKLAAEYIDKKGVRKEFNVIRTGGISNSADIIASKNSGVKLNQWFAGFFEMFSMHGFNLYREIFKEI